MYSYLSRSAFNRAEFRGMQVEFGKLLLPCALHEVRWIGRYRALKPVCHSTEAILQFLNDQSRVEQGSSNNIEVL